MDRVDQIIDQWRRERPDIASDSMGLFGRMKRLIAHLTPELETVFAEHGLSAAGFDVLATLRRSGQPYALTPSDLIAWTMVTSGTMTNRIDRLIDEGMVERRRNPADGRGFVIALTRKGKKVIDAAVGDHVANQKRLMSALTEKERAMLDDLLKTWLGAFEGDA